MSENTGDKVVDINENHGVGIGVGTNIGEIYNFKSAHTINEFHQQNLAEAAKDIQEILEQLDETYQSDTTVGRMKIATEVITQIDNNPTKAERIFNAIKAGGVAAVEQLLNHPASSFIIAALEDWQKNKQTK
ncbi:MAG: hypothetical protein F6K23_06365 [Okeania sp. SIO2C9]|uniref:hypothetical protein n=1 Tax=Okeania sp. SIO2C9 TaxID=2607791 RepID=UPI0013C1098B|nr:hypothetical protein [Okeania sp. SIO2C9]NEQ72729.1 hypothetical protein [Okeania sp. SIO2C9]